jgi:hypothetical protein
MRATVSVEFTDEELRKHTENLALKMLTRFFQGVKVDPDVMSSLFHQAVEAGMRSARAKASLDPRAYPPPRPQPYAPPRPYPAPRTQAYPPDDFTDPIPMRSSRDGAALSQCLRIEEGPYIEEGWCCHLCGIYNGVRRAACRKCKHERCDIVVTPPPSPDVDMGEEERP